MSQSLTNQDASSVPFSTLFRCLGFTLLLIVNDLILREPAIFIDGLGITDYSLPAVRIVLNIAFFGSLIIVGSVSLARGQEAGQRTMFSLQCASGAFSLLLLGATALQPIGFIPKAGLLCASFFALGLFASFGLMHWIALFSKVRPEAAWLEIVMALFVSSLGYVFILYAAAPFPTVLIFGAVYVLSLFVNGLACTRENRADDLASVEFRLSALRKHLPAVLCIAALNFVLTASRMSLAELSTEAINSICAGGICLAAAFLFFSSFVIRKDVEIDFLYQIAFPVIALAFLLLPYASSLAKGLFMLLSTTLGTMGTTVLILIALRAKGSLESTATGIYGISSGIVHIFLTVGLVTSIENYSEEGVSLVQSSVIALMVVYAFLLVFIISHRTRKQSAKDRSPIEAAGQGVVSICDRISEEYGLTQREAEIMREMMLGRSAGEIAKSLGISTSTVKTHGKNIYKKLDIHSKSELLALASNEHPAS